VVLVRATIRCSAALLLMVLATVACTRQLAGSGNVVSRQIPVSSFSKVRVSNTFVVQLSIGNPPAATVRVDDNLVGHLDVGVSGDTLRIGLKEGISVTHATLQADVTAPSVSAIDASGASTVTPSDPLASASFTLKLSGASSFDGSVDVTQGGVELSGASHAVLSGSATTMSVSASGASQLLAGDLSIGSLTIELSGASHGEVHVTGTISATASGASNLTYSGSPTFTKRDVSGASHISQS
jgi:Putative auto-transporter adhesin, head GIN domain